MLDTLSEPVIVAWIGLAGGVVLGLAARIGRFCTLGALEDFFYGDSVERLRMWGIAIGLSIMGSFAAQALGWVDLTQAIYSQPLGTHGPASWAASPSAMAWHLRATVAMAHWHA